MKTHIRNLIKRIGLSNPSDLDRGERELLVDISVIARHDARTGIQRVVRAIWLHLVAMLPEDIRLRPVYAGKRHAYVYAPDYFLDRGLPERPARADLIHPRRGDIFLGLDLAAHLLPRWERQIANWKGKGVSINMLVYDLLPVDNPQWFNIRTTRNFNRWLFTLSRRADNAICISHDVAKKLQSWIDRYAASRLPPLQTAVIRLGADIANSGPSKGWAANAASFIEVVTNQKTVLMVGTIEPRKGHDDALAAFDHLWAHADNPPTLAIIGKPGWQTEALQRRIMTHPENGKRLFWLQDVSDEMLEALFRAASGLLVASRAEGLGLPLLEGVQFGLPILARDLPVFRELELPGIQFFTDSAAAVLADHIAALVAQRRVVTSRKRLAGWAEATSDLLSAIGIPAAASAIQHRSSPNAAA